VRIEGEGADRGELNFYIVKMPIEADLKQQVSTYTKVV